MAPDKLSIKEGSSLSCLSGSAAGHFHAAEIRGSAASLNSRPTRLGFQQFSKNVVHVYLAWAMLRMLNSCSLGWRAGPFASFAFVAREQGTGVGRKSSAGPTPSIHSGCQAAATVSSFPVRIYGYATIVDGKFVRFRVYEIITLADAGLEKEKTWHRAGFSLFRRLTQPQSAASTFFLPAPLDQSPGDLHLTLSQAFFILFWHCFFEDACSTRLCFMLSDYPFIAWAKRYPFWRNPVCFLCLPVEFGESSFLFLILLFILLASMVSIHVL